MRLQALNFRAGVLVLVGLRLLSVEFCQSSTRALLFVDALATVVTNAPTLCRTLLLASRARCGDLGLRCCYRKVIDGSDVGKLVTTSYRGSNAGVEICSTFNLVPTWIDVRVFDVACDVDGVAGIDEGEETTNDRNDGFVAEILALSVRDHATCKQRNRDREQQHHTDRVAIGVTSKRNGKFREYVDDKTGCENSRNEQHA